MKKKAKKKKSASKKLTVKKLKKLSGGATQSIDSALRFNAKKKPCP